MRRDCLTPCMALENYNQSISMTLKILIRKTCAFIRSLNCLRGIGQIVNSTAHTQSNPEKTDNPLRLIAPRTSDLGVGVFGVHPSTKTAPSEQSLARFGPPTKRNRRAHSSEFFLRWKNLESEVPSCRTWTHPTQRRTTLTTLNNSFCLSRREPILKRKSTGRQGEPRGARGT